MAERVTEVEQRALALLGFIGDDDLRLVPAAHFDGVRQRIGIARDQRRHVGFEPVEEFAIADQSVLDHFGEPRAQLRQRECRERRGIDDDRVGLVERPDHVLAGGTIDAGLSADRRIDLRQQRRRHLDERDSPLVRGRRETRDVADDAAAQRDDRRLAVESRLEQSIENRRPRIDGLVLLSVRNGDDRRVRARFFERIAHPAKKQWGNCLVGDDGKLRIGSGQQRRHRVQRAVTDVDRVFAAGQRDVDDAMRGCTVWTVRMVRGVHCVAPATLSRTAVSFNPLSFAALSPTTGPLANGAPVNRSRRNVSTCPDFR